MQVTASSTRLELTGTPENRQVAVAPATRPVMHEAFVTAVREAGAEVTDLADARALIWADPYAPHRYPEVIANAPEVEWVQLPYAGIEPFVGHLDTRRVWSCAKGVYAEPVAEWIMAALLTGLRDFHVFAKAKSWSAESGRNLLGARVTVLGGGGITASLLRLLAPWGCDVTVVRRTAVPVEGASRTFTLDEVHKAVAGADAVVVALALTAQTRHVVDSNLLEAMGPRCWLINVARGGHVDHAALEAALRAHKIAGAVLDVTDPEPLPDMSALWQLQNCIITPHIGNTREMGLPLITERVRENVRRWLAGEQLLGLVNVNLGY